MGRKDYKTLIVAICCWLAGCVKDKPAAVNSIAPGGSGTVYIVCEGNFNSGDASLYAWQRDSVYGDLYKNKNSQPLGDVFQSMIRIGDNFFLCINNSDRITVVHANNMQLAGSISIRKPRYILPISSAKAYVSTLYSNKVYVINPQQMQVTDSIVLPFKDPEGMNLFDGYTYICTWDTAGNRIYKVNVATNGIEQAIQVAGYAPQEVLTDREQMLWVLAGDQPEGKTATLTRIDPSTGEILKSYIFPAIADPVKPVFNPAKDTLYFIAADYNGGTVYNGIYRMGIHDAALPAQPFKAAAQNQYFYSLGIDPANGDIYIGDPKGFIQKGTVYVYKPDGTQKASFNVGLGPGHFYFDK
jgi:DNA-binding beta-propeller fold protein YncE